MPVPPLFADSLALSEAVIAICDTAGLDIFERRAALEILGTVIGTGETSHVRAIQRVADVIDRERERLGQIAAEIRNREGVKGSPRIGTQSAQQEEIRWDLKE